MSAGENKVERRDRRDPANAELRRQFEELQVLADALGRVIRKAKVALRRGGHEWEEED